MKLSQCQIQTLVRMFHGEGETAYQLGMTMRTMNSLLQRGLIRRTNYDEITWLGWESTEYKFVITPEGLKILKEYGIIIEV